MMAKETGGDPACEWSTESYESNEKKLREAKRRFGRKAGTPRGLSLATPEQQYQQTWVTVSYWDPEEDSEDIPF
jgi:hypothetical protein